MKIAISLAIGLAIGAGCRVFDIPVPSPPTIVGVLLILSITVGYMTADRLLTARAAAPSGESRR